MVLSFPRYIVDNLKNREIVEYQVRAFKSEAEASAVVGGVSLLFALIGSFKNIRGYRFAGGVAGLSIVSASINYISYLQLKTINEN